MADYHNSHVHHQTPETVAVGASPDPCISCCHFEESRPEVSGSGRRGLPDYSQAGNLGIDGNVTYTPQPFPIRFLKDRLPLLIEGNNRGVARRGVEPLLPA